jgi:hypothetical protein
MLFRGDLSGDLLETEERGVSAIAGRLVRAGPAQVRTETSKAHSAESMSKMEKRDLPSGGGTHEQLRFRN